jgi:hypothetical protein
MTDHRRYQELAATQLDFGLEPADSGELERHLEGCPSCRRFVVYLRSDEEAIRRLPQRDAPRRVEVGIQTGHPIDRRRPRSGRAGLLLVAAVVVVAGVGVAALGAGARLISEDRPTATVPIASTAVVPNPSPAPIATSALEPPAAPSPLTWLRARDQTALSGSAGFMEAATPGGPGLVAVGDGCAAGDKRCHAAVWTSIDGLNWDRVPDDPVFDVGVWSNGRRGEMTDVIAGGPGLIAVGRLHSAASREAVVWTSPDGVTWNRDADEAAFARGTIEAVTAGGPGFVAVGSEVIGDQAVAAVWTSTDGLSWLRVPTIPDFDLGGPGRFNDGRAHGAMVDVAVGGPGLVAVGSACAPSGGSCRAAAWTSSDGTTWSRVADSPRFAGSMYAVAPWRGGVIAVGDDGSGRRARAWSSVDGTTWQVAAPIEGLEGGMTAVATDKSRIVAAAVSPNLHSAIFESTDGLHWRLTVSTAYLGNGAINGLTEEATSRITAVGWAGDRAAAAVWLGTP